jgi:CheY-like chemotaxis protein
MSPDLPQPTSRRILVVDDDVDAADLLAQLLAMDGHVTRAAYGGNQALEEVASFAPDVVILDIEMPVMDGYELARHIRQARRDRLPGLVSLSGARPDVSAAASGTFDVSLAKPASGAQVQAAIEASLRRTRLPP